MARTDNLVELHDRLTATVEALVTSEDWQRMLALASRFHRYSASNVLLILAQRPDATRVAGYRRWQSLGRQVRKGEHGIAILAPCLYRRRAGDDEDKAAQAEVSAVLRGFRVARVFDVSQTDGAALPEVRPRLLDGEDASGLWEGLAAQVGAAGFALERGDCAGANGRTDYATRTVRVRDDVAPAQATKTLAHELGHVLLHDVSRVRDGRDLAEVEAESVAYIVCAATGLDTADYTLPYVAHWSDGDPGLVRMTADRVLTAARQILEALDPIEATESETAA
jgi:antirestriction protein ArdC